MGNLILYSFGALCFGFGLFFPDSRLLTVGAIPFWGLLCAAVHEGGHYFCCKALGLRVKTLCIPLLCVTQGRACLRRRLWPESYCTFEKAHWAVFLSGPLASAFLSLLLLGLYLIHPGRNLLLGFFVSLAVTLGNAIAWKNSDMALFFRSLKKQV